MYKKTMVIYGCFITAISLMCSVSGLEYRNACSLFLGFTASLINYQLLSLAVYRLLGAKNFFACQIFLLRYGIYIGTACIAVKLGTTAAILYAAGNIGLSVSIFIVYGIGGRKEQ